MNENECNSTLTSFFHADVCDAKLFAFSVSTLDNDVAPFAGESAGFTLDKDLQADTDYVVPRCTDRVRAQINSITHVGQGS